MGQCYDVQAHLEPIDKNKESEAIKAILAFIDKHEGKRASFGVDNYVEKERLSKDNFSDLMHIMLGFQYFTHDEYYYEASFDASYGWYNILIDLFEVRAPYLTQSYMNITADESSCELTVEDGVMEFIDTTPEENDYDDEKILAL